MPSTSSYSPLSQHLPLLENLRVRATQAFRQLDDLIVEANNSANSFNSRIRLAYEAYDATLQELRSFTSDYAASLRRQFNSEPQEFRDSPEGEAVESLISDWEAFDPIGSAFDPPKAIPEPDDSELNQFSALPTEP